MKKYISLFLMIVLSLHLFAACGGKEAASDQPAAFCVGYAKADITPVVSVPLTGYGDEEARFSKGFLEYSYATCVAFSDPEGEKLLLISLDLGSCEEKVFDPIRKTIAAENDMPVSHVLITASHSHTSPYTKSQEYPGVKEFIQLLSTRIPEGAKAALADLAPATMETGFQRVDRLNTVRHYLLTNGKYQGKSVGSLPKDQLVGHYSAVDNLLQVVKFTRQGEKKPVVLVNWQGHPTGVDEESYYYSSPNYPGIMRTELENNYGCLASFVLSGSGNVNNGSQIASEIDYEKYDYKALGKLLAGYVGEILEGKLTTGNAEKITVSENILVTPNKGGIFTEVPLYAFSLGDWACVTAPFEIFDTNAMAVRDASPFKMTFYASCANRHMGYLPTPPSFDWEITYEAQSTKFPKGMAEKVQEQLIGQLNDIFAQSGSQNREKPEGYATPEFVPVSDDKVYENRTPGSWDQCQEVNNGFYSVTLLTDSGFKTLLCLDRSVAEKVVAQSAMKLVFNVQNVIVDVIPQ